MDFCERTQRKAHSEKSAVRENVIDALSFIPRIYTGYKCLFCDKLRVNVLIYETIGTYDAQAGR